MKKEDFIKALEILEYTDMIGTYNFLTKENAIKVYDACDGGDYDYTYYFDESNNLIHPQIIDIKEKIKKTRTRKTRI